MEKTITFKEFIELYYELTKNLTYVKVVPNATNKLRTNDLRSVYAGRLEFKGKTGTIWTLKNKMGTAWEPAKKRPTLGYYFINDKHQVDISFHSEVTWCLNNYKEVKYKKAEIAELFKCYENAEITYTQAKYYVFFKLKTDTKYFESYHKVESL